MAQHWRDRRARGIVVMAIHCDGCGLRVELVGDRAWRSLKRRLSLRPVHCDGCLARLLSRESA